MNLKPERDYLWDPSQPPAENDRSAADVQRLENALSRFAAKTTFIPHQTADALTGALRANRWTDFMQLAFLRGRMQVACASVALLIVLGFYFSWNSRTPVGSPWTVARISGSPRIGDTDLTSRAQFHPGQILSTDAASQARIEVEDLGEISVAQDSRVRLLSAGAAAGTLGLDQGTIHAMIWAPPRRFTVRTPAADAVDLGCSYTLHVSPAGEGWLRVSMGWVAFTDPQEAGRESFIPVGAMCLLKPHNQVAPTGSAEQAQPNVATNSASSIGTPFYEDASASFRNALQQFDFRDSQAQPAVNQSSQEQRSTALRALLSEARQRDALTLWHLLARTDAGDRAAVYDRLAALVPPPTGVVRETLLSADPALAGPRRQMRDLWWNALGLRDTDWWRYWERSAPPR